MSWKLRRRWRAFRAMDPRQRRRVSTAACYLVELRWRLSRQPLAAVLQAQGLATVRTPAAADAPVSVRADVRRAVAGAARLLPGRTTCLVRSLAEIKLLVREGRRADLCIGFRRDENGAIAAHAWLHDRSETEVDLGSYSVAARFRPD